MTKRAITFDDFSKGEYGNTGPSLPAGAGPGWFTGNNVMVYNNGSIGPRPGLKAVTRVGGSWTNGLVRVLYPSTNATQSTFIQIGTLARTFSINLATLEVTVLTAFGGVALPAPTTYPNTGQHRATGNWVMVPGTGLYNASMGTNNVALVTATVTGRAFRFYRDRQLAAHGDDTYYSDPGTAGWDTFPNFFTGTTFNPVTGFHELRNGIAIPQETPNVDLVTGTIGTTSAVLRRISTRTAPTDPYGCASIGSEFLVIMGRGLPYPLLYNGAVWEELRHLAYAGTAANITSSANGAVPAHTVVDLEYDDSWMILSGIVAAPSTNRMLLSWGGVRSYHTWGTTIGPFARRYNQAVVLLTNGGTSGAPPEFYLWYPDLNRPGFTSDAYSQPGDASTTPLSAYVHLPAQTVEDGQEVMVKGVIVEFTKWATGSASTNHFSVTVDARRRYSAAATVTSTAQVFDEAGASATTSGVDTAIHLGFGDQGYGTEFQVKIDDLRGCAIRKVTCILEVRPERI